MTTSLDPEPVHGSRRCRRCCRWNDSTSSSRTARATRSGCITISVPEDGEPSIEILDADGTPVLKLPPS